MNQALDDRTQLRIQLEAEAILGLLARCEAGTDSLVSSEILEQETDQNPQWRRKIYARGVLALADRVIAADDGVVQRAKVLEIRGFKAFDALHVACAEAGAVDRLCTCDDRFLKKARTQTDLAVIILSPLDLAAEVLT